MTTNLNEPSGLLVSCTILASFLAACGGEDPGAEDGAGTGGASTNAGAPGSESGGSSAASGGSVASGGSTGGAGGSRENGETTTNDGSYSLEACPGAPTMSVRSDFLPCDGIVTCGGAAHCIPADQVAEQLPPSFGSDVPDCQGNGKCIPDGFIRTRGRFVFKSCVSSYVANQIPEANAEGLCIPQCFALLRSPAAAILPKGVDGCGTEEVCAPCINPLTQEDTGSCGIDRCGP